MLKRFLPHSLFGRFLLIVVIPGVLLPLVATYVFYERHWKSVQKHMYASLVGEVAVLVHAVKTRPEAEVMHLLQSARHELALITHIEAGTIGSHGVVASGFEVLRQRLEQQLGLPVWFGYADENETDIQIDVQLHDHQFFTVKTSRKRVENPSTAVFGIAVLATALVLLAIAIVFAKNQLRAITQLAYAAEKFGKGLELTSFKPTGATEVRMASQAFIAMKERLKRMVGQRMEMLSGISHDLRTPLTRMKLQISLMGGDKDAVEELTKDIEEMEQMVNGYLDFARGEGAERPVKVALRDVMLEVMDQAKHLDAVLSFTMDKDVLLLLRRQAFKRAVLNVMVNAARYGQRVLVAVQVLKSHVVVCVEDDGPGIPKEEWGNVFKPFYRIEGSRNRDTGGTGLGLAIVQDIVHRQGGEVILGDSSMGGARVEIRLPL